MATRALKKQGEILPNATTFRFDGSDLMPGAVGAGSFWTGMVDYVGGKSAQEVADADQTHPGRSDGLTAGRAACRGTGPLPDRRLIHRLSGRGA